MRTFKRLFVLLLFLFLASPLRADSPIVQCPNHDVFPAVAYNSSDDEYLVVWSCLVPYGGIVFPWAGFVEGQRIGANGSLIGDPFIIIENWCVINVSVAYNSQDNEYMVAAAYGSPPEIYVQRVSNTGSTIGSPQVVLSNVQKPKILYNSLAGNYLVFGNGAGVYTRVISLTGLILANPVLVTDTTSCPDYAVAYAPISSPETPYGRFLLARRAVWLTMLDSWGSPMITFFDGEGNPLYPEIPFPLKTSSEYTVSLAYGSQGGNNTFTVIWSGAGTYASKAWPGIWAGSVDANQLVYSTNTSYPENGYPVSYINQDAFYANDVPTWMPTVDFNPATSQFFVTWRETPVAGPNSQVQVKHIRGDWAGRKGLLPNEPNFVLSSLNGGEDPKYPVVASSTKNGNVLVVWTDMRDSVTNATDLYGTLFDINQPVPIQLASFKASPKTTSSALLEWSTLSEVNNYGFEIQRRPDGDPLFKTLPDLFIPGHGTTSVPQSYSCIDATASAGVWWYRLRQIDLDQSVHFSEPVRLDFASGVQQPPVPSEFGLEQNYPNPFNPTTVIRYAVAGVRDQGLGTSYVRLVVYDLLGREAAVLVNERKAPGNYEVRFDGSGLAGGVYLYRMQVRPLDSARGRDSESGAGSFVQTRKLLLLR